MAHFPNQPLRHLAATLLTVAAALLAGCASTPTAPPPSPAPLLHDALFGHPARPAGADTVFALDEPMRAHLREVLLHTTRYSERPFTLAESLQPRTGLKLVYDASRTRSASEAFAARAGNCLSLVVMTAALAREAGLEVGFQPAYNTLGVVYQRAGHLVPATAAFERALDNDPKNLAAISNLELALRDQGRLADAAVWTARRLALEPFAPGHFLRQGLARAHLLRGERQQAEQALNRAAEVSGSPAEQARYAGKLDVLRAAQMP